MSLANKVMLGSVWMASSRMAARLLGLLSTVVLARLLGPEDFGLVAMAMLAVAFIEAASQMSFDVVLIQNQQAIRTDYDTVWTMNVLRGAVIAMLLVASAYPMVHWFEEPRLDTILYTLALGTVTVSFSNVGVVDFRKNLQFHKEFLFSVYVKVTGVVVTILAAWLLRSYWALVIGMLATQFSRVVFSYLLSPFRPRPTLRSWRPIFAISKWLMLNNILHYAQNRVGGLVLGSLLGPGSLGLYTIAHEISTLASSELLAPLRRALLPGYAKISQDEPAFRRGFLEGLAVMLAVGVPAAAGIGLTASQIVPLFLGDKWLESIPLLEILSVAAVVQIGTANCSPALLAKGYARAITLALSASVLISVPVVILGGYHLGAVGVCWGVAFGAFTLSASLIVMASRVLEIPWRNFVSATWRSPVSLLVMAIVVWPITRTSTASGEFEHALVLTQAVLAGATTYLGTHLVTWWACGSPKGAESRLLGFLANLLAARFPRRRISQH